MERVRMAMTTNEHNIAPPYVEQAEIRRQCSLCDAIEQKLFSMGFSEANRPGYFIQTFGCQQNEADSERMAGLAWRMGYRPVATPAAAQLILVNTCAIREHAEKKALSIIGTYKHIKEASAHVIIGVGGCMVTQKHRADQLKNSYPYVDFAFDTGALHLLPELIYHAMTGASLYPAIHTLWRRGYPPIGKSRLRPGFPSCTDATIFVPTALSPMCGAGSAAGARRRYWRRPAG